MNELENQVQGLEKQLADAFSKAPHLPKEWRTLLVSFAPWITLIGAIFSVVAIFSLISMMTSPLMRMANALGGSTWSIWTILTIGVMAIMAFLYLIAFPALKEKKKTGWNKLFLAQLVSIVYAIISLFGGSGSLIGTLVGVAIGLYLLFEVRDEYK